MGPAPKDEAGVSESRSPWRVNGFSEGCRGGGAAAGEWGARSAGVRSQLMHPTSQSGRRCLSLLASLRRTTLLLVISEGFLMANRAGLGFPDRAASVVLPCSAAALPLMMTGEARTGVSLKARTV